MAMLEELEAARAALIEKEVANIIRLRTYGPQALQSGVEQATVSFIGLGPFVPRVRLIRAPAARGAGSCRSPCVASRHRR